MNPFEKEIATASEKTGLPASIIAAVIAAESSGNKKAVSRKGAAGLMQLMPRTAKEWGVTDTFDPSQNIMAGSSYLKSLQDRFGSIPLALAAYNAGPGNVAKYGGIPPFKETQNYVSKLTGNLGGTMADQDTAATDLTSVFQNLMKPSRGEKIGTVLGGLAEVMASLNKWRGGELQGQVAAQNATRSAAARQEKMTGLSGLLSLMKGESTDDIKEFEYYKKKGGTGSFEDFLKIKPQAGTTIPGMEGLMPILLEKIKGQLKGPASLGQSRTQDLGGGFTLDSQ